jgi:Mg-chelatase subunit ChlI
VGLSISDAHAVWERCLKITEDEDAAEICDIIHRFEMIQQTEGENDVLEVDLAQLSGLTIRRLAEFLDGRSVELPNDDEEKDEENEEEKEEEKDEENEDEKDEENDEEKEDEKDDEREEDEDEKEDEDEEEEEKEDEESLES